MIRSGNSGWIRAKVFERDKGICAICRADAGKAERLVRRLERYRGIRRVPYEQQLVWVEAVMLVKKQWGREGVMMSFWEADHVVPVAEGGGGCGLEGYRTLCRPCHVTETAALRKRLAK